MTGPDHDHPTADMLADFAARVLPNRQELMVAEHVNQCTACTQLLHDADRVEQALHSSDQGSIPDAVWQQIRDQYAAMRYVAAPGSVGTVPPGEPGAALPPGSKPSRHPVTLPAGQPPRPSSVQLYNTGEIMHATGEIPAATTAWTGDTGWFRATGESAATVADAYPDATDGTRTWPQPAVPTIDTSAAQQAFHEAPTSSWQVFADAGPTHNAAPPQAIRSPATSRVTTEQTTTVSVQSRLDHTRARARQAISRVPTTSRRELREDQQVPWWRAHVKLLAGIAAGLAVLLVLGLFWKIRGGETSAGQVQGTGSGTVPAVASGTMYTQASLANQAQSMVTADRPDAVAIAGDATLQNPDAMRRCLEAIKESRNPIAADFARYQGLDAVILAFSGTNSSYDVYVVSRTCPTDADPIAAANTRPTSSASSTTKR